MDNKPVITYVKDGKENVITFNKIDLLNPDKKLMNVFRKINHRGKKTNYIIDSEVKFIHIKNYTFKETFHIEGYHYDYGENYTTTLILENCTFKCSSLLISYILTLKILNPIFQVESTMQIENAKDVNIILGKKSEKINISVDSTKKLTLESSSCLKKLDLNLVRNSYLKNFEGSFFITNNIPWHYYGILESNVTLENYHLISQKLHIGENTNINLKLVKSTMDISTNDPVYIKRIRRLRLIDSSVRSINDLNLEALTYLYLRNSFISSKQDIYLKKIDNIEFDDLDVETILDSSSYIEVGKYIIVRDKIISNQNQNLIINIESLEKNVFFKIQKLLNVLYQHKEQLELLNEKKILALKEKNKQILELIEEEMNKSVDEYKSNLEKKRIRDL